MTTPGELLPTPKRDWIYFDALRYCERYGIKQDKFQAVEASMRIRAFQEAMEPYIRMISSLSARRLLTVILRNGEIAEAVGNEIDPKLLAQFKAVEKSLAEHYGIPTEMLPDAAPTGPTLGA